jgi:opacity protein-like surface antigen
MVPEMMKRSLTISAVVLSSLLSLPTLAFVKNPSYVSAQVGAAVPHGKLAHETSSQDPLKKAPNTAAVFDIYAGTQVFANTYVELEFAYAKHNFRHSYLDAHANAPVPLPPTTESFKTTVRTMSGFANLSYRFNNLNSFIVPYVTAGAGISSNKVGGITISDPDIIIPGSNGHYETAKGKTVTHAAWQIGAGALMKLTKMVSLNLSYKYRHLGSVKTPATTTDAQGVRTNYDTNLLSGKIRTHNILLGITVDL